MYIPCDAQTQRRRSWSQRKELTVQHEHKWRLWIVLTVLIILSIHSIDSDNTPCRTKCQARFLDNAESVCRRPEVCLLSAACGPRVTEKNMARCLRPPCRGEHCLGKTSHDNTHPTPPRAKFQVAFLNNADSVDAKRCVCFSLFARPRVTEKTFYFRCLCSPCYSFLWRKSSRKVVWGVCYHAWSDIRF